mmetsp:Transcript_30/g.37  ORF Transcript_30/g.37 Transcript_30/m.37 type:complete len:261 (+) Transcript_30:127-909(+)
MRLPAVWQLVHHHFPVSFDGTIEGEAGNADTTGAQDADLKSLDESEEGPLKTVYGVVKDIESFQKEHLAYNAMQGKDQPLPQGFESAWQQIWDRRDSLNKVKDRLYQCRAYEQALVGPQPGNMTDGQADQEAMQNSLSSKVDDTLDATKRLVAEVEHAQALLGDTEKTGLADQVKSLLEHMTLAKKPLDDMMLGSTGSNEEVSDVPSDQEDVMNEQAMPISPLTLAVGQLVLSSSSGNPLGLHLDRDRRKARLQPFQSFL